ncbi:MAG: hypothetical protein ACLFQB_01535 [Chitinispirillaceae bacterium]
MEQLSQEQIRRFIDEIGVMKKAIRKNRLILQQITFTKTLQFTSLFAAFAIIGLTLIHLLLQIHYGDFSYSPQWVKVLFYVSVVLAFVTGGILKNSGILSEARRIDPNISIFKVMKEISSHRIAHTEIAIWSLVVFFSTISLLRGHVLYIIPVLALGIGLSFLLYWVLFRVRVFLLDGYWLLLSGCFVIAYPSIGPHFGLILTMGAAMLIFGVSASLPKQKTTDVEN